MNVIYGNGACFRITRHALINDANDDRAKTII